MKWKHVHNIRHSAKVKLVLCHITWIYIHAKFEYGLNTSIIISQTIFVQRGMLLQDYWPYGQKKTVTIHGPKVHILKHTRIL